MCEPAASSFASSTSGYSTGSDSAESGEGGQKCAGVAPPRRTTGEALVGHRRRKCAFVHHHVRLHQHQHRISSRQHKQHQQKLYSAAAVEQLVALQHQYAAVAASYARLQSDARVRNLRQRVARAKQQSSYAKAAQVLSQPRSQPQSPRQEDGQPGMASWQQQQAGVPTPSLPALTLVVKMLLQLASAKASPSLAAQLRQQLLQQVKAAAAAAKDSSQEFSVAATVHSMLPGLRAAVLQACRQQEAAAASTAAVVEAALTTAACEVQLCSLTLGQQQQEPAAHDKHAWHRADGLSMDIDDLLQAEMASAMSAQL